MIHGIAGAGIGLLVGLLGRPFLEAYIAARTAHEAVVEEPADDAAPALKQL